ncbi:MAG: hypothetical protein U0939_12135 [Pirellulales bacterium]
MSRSAMMMLAASVDIWAALFLVQLLRPQPAWEASVTMQSKANSAAATPDDDRLSIWLTSHGMGIWPDRDRTVTIEELERHVKREVERRGEPASLRLLCDSKLEIREWSRVAVKLSAHVRDVHIAPLPASDQAAGSASSNP